MGVTPAQRFLETLWGPNPPGYIHLWRLSDRRSWYARSANGAAYYADGHTDVYTGAALAGQDHGRLNRTKAAQTVAIAGLWLDIDVNGGPENKAGVAPTKQAALDLAHRLAEPTLTVDSGYGIHAWHLFHQPLRFRNLDHQAEWGRASAQWYALHRGQAHAQGWSIDHTHDLARLLRPPGTINGKGGGRAPVTLISGDGPLHDSGRLLEVCSAAGDVQPQTTLGRDAGGGELPQVDVGPARALSNEILEALIENSAEFKRTWMHARNDHWSLSEYDLALCSIAAQGGLHDQQLADLIALHRRTYDPSDHKGQRLDYVQRTVAKARHSAERARDVDWFKTAAQDARGVAA